MLVRDTGLNQSTLAATGTGILMTCEQPRIPLAQNAATNILAHGDEKVPGGSQ